MSTKWFLIVAVAVAVGCGTVALTAPAPRLQRSPVAPVRAATKLRIDPNLAPPPEPVGFRLPDVVLQDLDGRPVALSAFRRKVVMLDLFASDCDPCKEEMPELVKIASKLAGQEFVLLGVSREPAATLRAAIAGRGLNYPVLRDVGYPLRRALGSHTIPRVVIVDRDGVVVAHHRGYRGDIRPIYHELRRLGLRL